jgi:hypothetical protein
MQHWWHFPSLHILWLPQAFADVSRQAYGFWVMSQIFGYAQWLLLRHSKQEAPSGDGNGVAPPQPEHDEPCGMHIWTPFAVQSQTYLEGSGQGVASEHAGTQVPVDRLGAL